MTLIKCLKTGMIVERPDDEADAILASGDYEVIIDGDSQDEPVKKTVAKKATKKTVAKK